MAEGELPGIVVIGASAASMDDIATVLESLPSSFSVPIVVAVDGSNDQARSVADTLSPRSPLPVVAADQQTDLNAGTVVVARAIGTEIVGRSVLPDSSSPVSDRLFATGAREYADNLITVLLDAGAESVDAAYATHKYGGTVIARTWSTADNPHTAPLLPYLVDVHAPLNQIGTLLVDTSSGALDVARPDEQDVLQHFLDYIRDRSGVDFHSYKPATISRRLQRRVIASGRDTLSDYVRYVQSHPEEYDRLLSSFLIKVTEFFRDPEMYNYLRDHVLPGLIEEARHRGSELRIWSAGAATGEEAYSLAIQLTEILGDDLDDLPLRIFATDIDEDAIEFARRGIYPASAVANLSPTLIHRAFTEVEGEYEIKKRIRNLIVFGHHDLTERAPFPHIDLLVSRNVLIYFTPSVQRRVLQLFAFSLRNGGYLVLGKAETTNPLQEFFAQENPTYKIYRRRGARTLIPPPQNREPMPLPAVKPHRSSAVGRRERGQERAPLAERADRLLQRLPVGVTVVDRHYDIVTINNAARRFLGIHDLALGEDLIHAIQTISTPPLRQAIDSVFRSGERVILRVETETEITAGGHRVLDITCEPEQVHDGEALHVVLITIVEATVRADRIRTLEDELAVEREKNSGQAEQLESLIISNQNLLQANEELALSNADLRSGNEELLVGQEELQAAMEEVETLNEELQATNEELETLNEELQATIEELNATNEDLQARTGELQELANSLATQRQVAEMERTRIELILSTLGDAVLVVDENGERVRANERYDEIFGRPGLVMCGENGKPLPQNQAPQVRAGRGESFTMTFSTETDGKKRRFEAIGRPVDNQGAVVVIREID